MITVLACSLVAGAVDTTSERVEPAVRIFEIGLLVLAIHAGLFIYRSYRKKQKSKWVFWTVVGLSVLIIPVTAFMLGFSAGASCGYGASNGPIFLLVFELVGIAAQIIAWRIVKRPFTSPVPLD